MIYLLHSTVPLVRSNGTPVYHYVGWTRPGYLAQRISDHRRGRSKAKIIHAFLAKGGNLLCVRIWPEGGPALEQYLKRSGHISDHCPICAESQRERRKAWPSRKTRYSKRRANEPLPKPESTSGGDLSPRSLPAATSSSGASLHEQSRASITPYGERDLRRLGGGTSSTVAVQQSLLGSTSSAGTRRL